MRPTIPLASSLLLIPLLASCAGVRSTARGWSNEDMVGKPAPELATGERPYPGLVALQPTRELGPHPGEVFAVDMDPVELHLAEHPGQREIMADELIELPSGRCLLVTEL